MRDRPNRVAKTEKRQTRQTVVVLEAAKKEGRAFLTPGQYEHIVQLEQELVEFGSSKLRPDLDIRQLEGTLWELRDKGGVLGKKNVRVYFAFLSERHEIVVLSTYKKEDDGPLPRHIVIRVKNRLRHYCAGSLDESLTKYKRKP